MSKANYDSEIPSEIFNYRKSPYHYFTKTAAHASVGLALGVTIDKVCKRVQDGYKLRPGVMIIIQLVVLIIVFYIIEIYLKKGKKYLLETQNITGGLFFAGLLFGSQFNLFQNIKKFAEPL